MASATSEQRMVHFTWSGSNRIFSSDIKRIDILGLEKAVCVYPPKGDAITPK